MFYFFEIFFTYLIIAYIVFVKMTFYFEIYIYLGIMINITLMYLRCMENVSIDVSLTKNTLFLFRSPAHVYFMGVNWREILCHTSFCCSLCVLLCAGKLCF